MAIDFHDHIARSEAGIFRRARRTDSLNSRSLYIGRNVKLLPEVGCQVIDSQSQLSAFRRCRVAIARHFLIGVKLANGEIYCLRLPSRTMPREMVFPGASSATATCSALPFRIFCPSSWSITSPALQSCTAGG